MAPEGDKSQTEKEETKCSGFKKQTLLSDAVSEGQETGRSLSGWLCLRVSHKVGVKMSAGLQSHLVVCLGWKIHFQMHS